MSAPSATLDAAVHPVVAERLRCYSDSRHRATRCVSFASVFRRNPFLQRKRFCLLLHIFPHNVVCLSSLSSLSHLCILLKPFNEFRCHLGKDLEVEPSPLSIKNMQMQIAAAT